jgi:hypothetical protein
MTAPNRPEADELVAPAARGDDATRDLLLARHHLGYRRQDPSRPARPVSGYRPV